MNLSDIALLLGAFSCGFAISTLIWSSLVDKERRERAEIAAAEYRARRVTKAKGSEIADG